MKNKILAIIIGITLLSVSGCGMFSKKYTKAKTDEYRLNTAGKKKVKLDNVNGTVTITHSNDSGALLVKAVREIKVKKKYLDTPFDEIEIKIDTTGSNISIATEIEKKGEDGLFKFNIARGQRVDYEIQIPSGLDIEVENVHGNIVASSLDNDLKIDLVNGKVSLENYSGLLECEITNGEFTGHIDSTRGININTVNGSVSLFLNNYINANLRAETSNGKIVDDNLNFRDVIKEKGLFKGKLGNGGNANVDIKVETVNGRIKLYGRNEI